ncbi:FAD-binding protein, partial [Cellulomonas bogoriensis 69B4 = DSM 16987]
LAGDETAAPAICSILERLPDGARAHAYVEVPTAHDVLDVELPDGAQLTWLPRHRPGHQDAPHGAVLHQAVATTARRLARATVAGVAPQDVDVDDAVLWDVPGEASAPDGLYSWIAGEATVVRDLRRHLVGEVGLDRRSVAFMGYWRAGRAEG